MIIVSSVSVMLVVVLSRLSSVVFWISMLCIVVVGMLSVCSVVILWWCLMMFIRI